jgi:DNA-binding winged helix-turn-helix (wHTH) protein
MPFLLPVLAFGESVTGQSACPEVIFSICGRCKTVRHATLEHAAWGLCGAVTPNALEVAVHRLRKKLAAIGATTRLANIRGAGFALQTTSAFAGWPTKLRGKRVDDEASDSGGRRRRRVS